MSLAPLDLQERSVANICIYRWSLHWSFFATSASFFEELGFENLHLKNGMAEGLYDHTKDKSFLFLLQLLVFCFGNLCPWIMCACMLSFQNLKADSVHTSTYFLSFYFLAPAHSHDVFIVPFPAHHNRNIRSSRSTTSTGGSCLCYIYTSTLEASTFYPPDASCQTRFPSLCL